MGNEGTNYSDLKGAASGANSACKELEDYSDLLTKKVLNKLSSLPGSDSKGYISSAMSAARSKQTKLDQSFRDFQSFGKDIISFKSYAEQKDKEVSKKISNLADPYKKGFSFGGAVEYIGNFLYNTFCVDLAGFISDYIPLGDMFMDGLRNIGNTVSHWMENTRDWFKYGGGKYLANIIGSVVKVVGIVAGIIAVASSSIFIVAVVGVIAGGAYLIYEMTNMMATVDSNMTAMEESRKGNKGLAHYYAGVESVKDYVEKNDLGSAEDNERWTEIAKYYDAGGQIAGGIYGLASMVTSVETLGDVYGLKGNVVDHDFSWGNIKRNIQRQWYQKRMDAGIIFKHDEMGNIKIGGVNLLKLTGIKGGVDGIKSGFKSIFNYDDDKGTAADYAKHIKGINKLGKNTFDFLTDGRSDNVKSAEKIDAFIENPKFTEIPDLVSSFGTLGGQGGLSEFTETYLEPWTKLGENINTIGGGVNDIVSDTELDDYGFTKGVAGIAGGVAKGVREWIKYNINPPQRVFPGVPVSPRHLVI